MTSLAARLKGTLGLWVLGAAYLVLGSALVQWMLANNARRRMDVVVSGGVAGLGLLVAGGVVLLAERAVAYADERDRADAAFVARLRATTSAGSPALVALPDLVLASAQSYHREGCLLAEGRDDLSPLPLAQAIGGGRTACRLCLKGLA